MRRLILLFLLLFAASAVAAQSTNKLYIGDVGLWDVIAVHHSSDGKLEARYVKLPVRPKWEGFRLYRNGRFFSDVLSIYHEDTGRRSTGIGIVVTEYGVPLLRYAVRPAEHYATFLTALNRDLGTNYEPPSDTMPIGELK